MMLLKMNKKTQRLYDDFTNKYGLLNSRGNSIAFREDSAYYLLCSLENIDEDGTLKSKADIFTKRTIKKHIVKDHVETSNEALMLSLSEKGDIDFNYMESLTDFDKRRSLMTLKVLFIRFLTSIMKRMKNMSLLMNI